MDEDVDVGQDSQVGQSLFRIFDNHAKMSYNPQLGVRYGTTRYLEPDNC